MKITFPINCTTEASRMAWCYRAEEKLRLIHNAFSRWWDTGLTLVQHNKFPANIKSRYPYIERISTDTRRDFLLNIYSPLEDAIALEMGKAIDESRASVFWTPDFDEDIK